MFFYQLVVIDLENKLVFCLYGIIYFFLLEVVGLEDNLNVTLLGYMQLFFFVSFFQGCFIYLDGIV